MKSRALALTGFLSGVLFTGMLFAFQSQTSPQPPPPPPDTKPGPPAGTPGLVPKKRIAIINFEDSSAEGKTALGKSQGVGKGVTDLLVNKMAADGAYTIIDRQAVEKLLAEQDFSNSSLTDADSLARLGKSLGVDAIVIGNVTQFDRDDTTGKVATGFGNKLGGLIGGQRKATAVVGISARIVNVDTGQILALEQAKSEVSRTSVASAAGSKTDVSNGNFGSTLIGEATTKAVADLATKLDSRSDRIRARTVQISGLVASVAGNTIILNIGTRDGIKVGQELAVTRTTRELQDPATGPALRDVAQDIGTIVITEVDATSSVGTFSGSTTPKVRDTVKPK